MKKLLLTAIFALTAFGCTSLQTSTSTGFDVAKYSDYKQYKTSDNKLSFYLPSKLQQVSAEGANITADVLFAEEAKDGFARNLNVQVNSESGSVTSSVCESLAKQIPGGFTSIGFKDVSVEKYEFESTGTPSCLTKTLATIADKDIKVKFSQSTVSIDAKLYTFTITEKAGQSLDDENDLILRSVDKA